MELKTLFIADNVLSQLFVILTCTGNSFEVKIEADSGDVTDYVQDDKPRTNIGTKRSSKDRKSMNNREKQYHCTVGGEGNLRPRRPPREYLGEYTS